MSYLGFSSNYLEKIVVTVQGSFIRDICNSYLKNAALGEKCPNTELFLARIFPAYGLNTECIWENTDQEKLRIWTLFRQCSERLPRQLQLNIHSKKWKENKDILITYFRLWNNGLKVFSLISVSGERTPRKLVRISHC